MRGIRTALSGLLAWGLLSGCAPTLDTDDAESLQDSLKKLLAAHTPSEQQQLADALIEIALNETAYAGQPPRDAMALARDPVLSPALMTVLDGETYEEVLERADSLRLAKAEQTIAAAAVEVKALRDRLDNAREELRKVAAVEVSSARYQWTTGDFMPQAVIEFELVNGTDTAITGVKFRGQLTSPDRDSPWVKQVLSYELMRPQAGHTRNRYRLVPSQFGEWANRQFQKRDDLRLGVQVINARVGDRWLVSDDPETLEQQLRQIETGELKARAVAADIRARRPQ